MRTKPRLNPLTFPPPQQRLGSTSCSCLIAPEHLSPFQDLFYLPFRLEVQRLQDPQSLIWIFAMQSSPSEGSGKVQKENICSTPTTSGSRTPNPVHLGLMSADQIRSICKDFLERLGLLEVILSDVASLKRLCYPYCCSMFFAMFASRFALDHCWKACKACRK